MLRRLESRSLNLSLHDLDKMMDWQLAGQPTTAGVAVNLETARSLTAVFCAERILSETVATPPLELMSRGKDGKRRAATQHPLRRVIHKKPNPWQTSFEFRRMVQGHTAVRGNGYAEIVRSDDGYPRYLIPRNPDKIKSAQFADFGVGYGHTMPDGRVRPIPIGDMLHFRGPSSDGITGDSLVTMFRNVIGLALATEEHGARLFSNGTQVPYAVKHPGKLGDKAYQNVKESLKEFSGVHNAHKLMFLEEGMSIERLGLTAEDSQFLQSRKFHISEFARIFRIPAHMLSDLDRATFSNIEHMSLEFLTYTMLPWFVMWEQRMDVDLLSEADQDEYYTKFNLNGLARADMQTRFASYAVGKQWGWLNSNKILELEDMDPIEGRAGDVYLQPMNMRDASLEEESEGEGETVLARMLQGRLRKAHHEIFRDAASRCIRKEAAALRKAIDKYKDDALGFEAYADIFYGGHAPAVVRSMLPALLTYAQAITAASLVWEAVDIRSLEQFIAKYVEQMASRYVSERRSEVKDLIQRKALGAHLDEFESEAPSEIALRESAELMKAMTTWLQSEIPVHA